MKQFFFIYFFVVALTVSLLGFRGCTFRKPPLEIFPDMDRQARFHEQSSSGLFADGRSDRPQIPGTVPFVTEAQETFPHLAPDNRFREDAYLATGKKGGDEFGDGIPIELTAEAMDRGEELYDIFCSVCHGASGNGKGVVAQPRYGYPTIVSLLDDRLYTIPDGEIFNTITMGKNTMGPYGAKIRVEDRWKVVLYVRALQRAGRSSLADVPESERGALQQ